MSRTRLPQNCKACGKSPVHSVGDVDFNWVSSDPPPFPPSGMMVPYWQCQTCGFAWAPVFDTWTDEQFSRHIYNDKIALAETAENAAQRCHNVMARLRTWFADAPTGTRFLDYGCGPGLLVDALRAEGFNAAGYDRFRPEFARKPEGVFDIVTAFEVLEHINDIQATVNDMLSFLAPDGILVLGTFLTSRPMDIDWWYCSPRSGHISFWTVSSLELTFRRRKLNVLSNGNAFHFVYPQQAEAKIRQIQKVGM